VFVLEHPGLLGGLFGAEVGVVPILEIGELVVGGQIGVGLAVPLDLGDLHQGLPAHAGLCVGLGQGRALVGLVGEHSAIAGVGVVGDGEDAAAGLGFVSRQELPQVLRVVGI